MQHVPDHAASDESQAGDAEPDRVRPLAPGMLDQVGVWSELGRPVGVIAIPER